MSIVCAFLFKFCILGVFCTQFCNLFVSRLSVCLCFILSVCSFQCSTCLLPEMVNKDTKPLRSVFSERELALTFAICYRPSVCRLSDCRL